MRRKHFSGCVACFTSLWDRKHTKLNRNTQEMCESDSSALLGCKVRWAHPGHCREKLMQEVSALTELGVIQSVVKWFPCFTLPCLFQFLSTEPNSSISQSQRRWYPNKEQALSWYLNLWHWFNLDGTEERQFRCLSARKASSVCTSDLHRSFSSL